MAKAKILLVEDSKTQGQTTKKFLEESKYEVVWVKDGTSTIKAVKTAQYDVILLDLILPDINGKEVCRWIKVNNDTKGIPIIMVTAKGEVEDKVAGLEAGADDYLPKPYNEIELNARIYAALRNKALQDELRQKNKQMEDLLARVEILAVTDPLTGLYNRRHLENILGLEWKKTKRYNYPLTCLMLDIDHFKSVNDTYGHKSGDSVLKEIAELIKKNIREVDSVARWGGEEFIAILPQTDRESAMNVASRLLTTISTYKFVDVPDRQITTSIGLAYSGNSIDTSEKLISAADFALYQAKRNGRNRIETATEDIEKLQ